MGGWGGAAVAAAMAIAASRVGAQGCEQAVLDLSRFQLEQREGVPALAARRLGLEAAYLLLRYDPATQADPTSLFTALDELDIAAREELLATWLISQGHVADGVAVFSTDPVRAVATMGPSAARALILADGGATYFQLLARVRTDLLAADPALAPRVNGSWIVGATADLDDATLSRLARVASASGLDVQAATLLAERSDLAELDAFVAEPGQDEWVRELADPVALMRMPAAALHGALAPRLAAMGGDLERAEVYRDLYDIVHAQALEGEASYLGIYANQTGDLVEAAAVARALIDEVQSGRLDPAADPEAAWVLEYRALATLVPRERLHRALSSFDFPPPRVRFDAGHALASLDRMLASEALALVAIGERPPPTRPAALADGFDWDGWVEAAEAVAVGDFDSLAGLDVPIAIELLADQGRYAEAMAVGEGALDPTTRLRLAADLVRRADRRCHGAMASPGQSLLMPGAVLFRFPEAGTERHLRHRAQP